MHILYLFAEMDKKHEKRQVPPALQRLLKADVYMTNLLCTMMNKFLPFRSLKVHYKLLEVSLRNRDVEVDVNEVVFVSYERASSNIFLYRAIGVTSANVCLCATLIMLSSLR